MEPQGTPYPLDVQALEKGVNYDLEGKGIFDTKPTDDRRKLELLAVRDEVQGLADAAGLKMSLRIIGNSTLRVMTDSEADDYHDRHSEIAVRKLGRHVHSLQSRVDHSALTPEQKARHLRHINRRGMQYMAARLSEATHRRILGEAKVSRLTDQTKERPNPFKRD